MNTQPVVLASANATLVDQFNARIDALVASLAGQPAIVALMGFGAVEAAAIAARPDSLSSLSGTPLPMVDGALDLAALLARRALRAARNAVEDAEAPVVCTFEEYAPLANALTACFEGQVVVARNDLFDAELRYPTPLAAVELERFVAYADHSIEEQVEAPACAAFYAAVEKHGDAYLVSHVRGDWSESASCREVAFYGSCPMPRLTGAGVHSGQGLERIAVPSAAFTQFKQGLSAFAPRSVELAVGKDDLRGSVCSNPAVGIAALLLDAAGCPCALAASEQANAGAEYAERLRPILKKHWGESAEYRMLKLFKDPDCSMELEEVSQGVVAGYAAAQAEAALGGTADYTDLFVTAPTGAGKSALFQLPALYLAQQHGAVTVVVEPLKSLMRDQVRDLRSRGARNVAMINGDMSFAERTEVHERIHSGEVSIVYLAPELLLSSSLEAVIGTRELGMVVIDEAHTVTTWGKDFRPDYWYLGSFLAKARRAGRRFPIFCLTATAVYGGVDDVVMQTCADLELVRPKLFLGSVRRDDIAFDIRNRDKRDYSGPIDEVKTRIAAQRIAQLATQGEGQSIVYCPYRAHITAIMEEVDEGLKATGKVLGYHGGMTPEYRSEVERRFKLGECHVLVSTKAYGMGLDIDDIVRVYHYAPTGNLSDHVQEIGRAARRVDLDAVAEIDFFRTDANYSRKLYAMSTFTQGQLREVMRKLYALYRSRPVQSQNMLVSPESFAYLFDDCDKDARVNKAKSALLMVAKDLERRCNYPVVVVNPGSTKTRNYVCVADTTRDALVARYGDSFLHLRKLQEKRLVREAGAASRSSSVVASDLGSIYELETARLWETHFSHLSFNDFKRRLFTGEILGVSEGLTPISQRTCLTINYPQGYDATREAFDKYVEALGAAFVALRRGGNFTEKQFRDVLKVELEARELPMPKDPSLLLGTFVMPYTGERFCNKRPATKCLTSHTRGSGENTQLQYSVSAGMLEGMKAALRRTMGKCAPNEEGERYVAYLNRETYSASFELAELLEVLGLAVYENLGGTGSDLFVRLNHPGTLRAFSSNARFSNEVLRELRQRHERSTGLITRFFTAELDDAERWDLIEHYFLGHDDEVCARLGMTDQAGAVEVELVGQTPAAQAPVPTQAA